MNEIQALYQKVLTATTNQDKIGYFVQLVDKLMDYYSAGVKDLTVAQVKAAYKSANTIRLQDVDMALIPVIIIRCVLTNTKITLGEGNTPIPPAWKRFVKAYAHLLNFGIDIPANQCYYMLYKERTQ